MSFKKLKKITLLTCMIAMLGAVVFAAELSDISGHWAETNITTLVDAKVINGYPDGTFRPNGTISKAEFLKLLMSASVPSWYDITGDYTTVAHWAIPYVNLANTYNVVPYGELTVENLDEPVTRKEMALWIAKADISMVMHDFKRESVISFTDCGEMTNEEISWLNHTVASGLITGYPDNTFGPDRNMTRAEAATVIYRYTR